MATKKVGLAFSLEMRIKFKISRVVSWSIIARKFPITAHSKTKFL